MPLTNPMILPWLRDYPSGALRPDVIAGLTTAAVVIPKAMAYASIAGLPVEVGLYTVFVPMVIYAVLGSSRPLSVSTTTTIAILTGAALGHAVPGAEPMQLIAAAATLALLVGITLVVASFLRFGFLASFISEPVLVGFKTGIGLVIVIDQVPKLLGVHIDKGGFFHNVIAVVGHLPETSAPTLAVAVVTVALLLALHHLLPRIPAPLVAVAVGIGGSMALGLADRGVELIGDLPRGLPSPTLPVLSLALEMWPAALGIALMSFVETVAAARAFAGKGEPPLNANRELLATGIASIGGGLMSAMPAGGGTSQTAVNRLSGARTQLATVVTAGTAVAVMLLLAPLMGFMPKATLAAVVIVYSVELIQPQEFKAIFRIRRMEFTWAAAACLGVMVLGTLKGILVAVILSLIGLMRQATNPRVYAVGRQPDTLVFRPLSEDRPNDETVPGLLMVRVEGRIFFGNAEVIRDRIKTLVDAHGPSVIAFDMSRVFDLEYSALKLFIDSDEKLREQGITLWLAGLNPDVREVVERSPLAELLGPERIFARLSDAIGRHASENADNAGAGPA